MSVCYKGKTYFNVEKGSSVSCIKSEIERRMGIPSSYFYLLSNGKIVNDSTNIEGCLIHITPRLVGGKGGFGSMLRAIGAQIEKTTNREACRDLSGRRLRDINEEKRLKTWIAQQAEREKEADDRRQKKLERLVQKPKHEFKDEFYEKERSALPEKVEDALEQGLKASGSGAGSKRKSEDELKKKKKPRLWLESDDELSLSGESDSENEDEGSNSNSSSSQNKTVTPDNVIVLDNNSEEKIPDQAVPQNGFDSENNVNESNITSDSSKPASEEQSITNVVSNENIPEELKNSATTEK